MDRRRLLRGAAAAAAAGVLLPTARAQARPEPGGSAAEIPAAGAADRAAGRTDATTDLAAADVDYPLADWAPATSANYTAASRPSSYPVDYVVVHITQETFADTVTIFQNPARQVSAHYVVRSSDGHVAQCVRERNVAWHAGNWDYNTRSIGIEHEGWVDKPGYFTRELYARSAALTASVCDRYGIPKDRAHIIGHNEVPGATHSDPGPHWDWVRYIRMVNLT
ncbi:peptidoglycan recognition family protein [Streptomyces sp. NPDC051907]|uniref:N-acetylmuramoyl-L-alanine amidase n=1 Tax=Streptomyces sp. NPDC051907 TaxID=3155284 RepID=UPI0034410C1C